MILGGPRMMLCISRWPLAGEKLPHLNVYDHLQRSVTFPSSVPLLFSTFSCCPSHRNVPFNDFLQLESIVLLSHYAIFHLIIYDYLLLQLLHKYLFYVSKILNL